jgi:Flp pilus assembly pilin Flp
MAEACGYNAALGQGCGFSKARKVYPRMNLLRAMWQDDQGQDVAEYAVMLAVILIIVIGTVKLIGGKSNNVFSEVASSLPG